MDEDIRMGEKAHDFVPDIISAATQTAWTMLPPEWQLAQPAAALLSEAAGRLGIDHFRRNRQTLRTAAEVAGVAEEELLSRLSEDPARRELLRRTLEASGAALTAKKVDALGSVLARGIDQTRVDEALWLARALGALEAPHVEILVALDQIAQEPPSATDMVLGAGMVYLHTLQSKLPGHRLVLTGALATMEQLSLVLVSYSTTPGVSVPGYSISELGRECLCLLSKVGRGEKLL